MSKPEVICLIGSSRFGPLHLEALKRETLAGKIVLIMGLFGHAEGLDMDGPVKKMLDELHLRKIDLADTVLVINGIRGHCSNCGKWYDDLRQGACGCDGVIFSQPYIGSSTRNELAYARGHSKKVRWLNPINRDAVEGEGA